jgi:hypothetical protein
VPGGRVVLLWDAPTHAAWSWRYEPGIAPMAFAAPGVDRKVRLAVEGEEELLVYDFWADGLQATPAADGLVTLPLTGRACGLYYVGPASETLRDTVAGARALRRRMRDLGFDSVGM